MALAFDAVGPAGGAGTAFTATPGTWTHVNGGNGIFVGVTIINGSTNTVSGVTYGGVTVPFLAFVQSGAGGTGGVALYGLVGVTCPTGSNTVSVAFTDGVNHNAGSVSVSGAGSLGTVFSSASGSSVTSWTQVVSSTQVGGLIVAAACYGGGTGSGIFSGTNGVTVRWAHDGDASTGANNGVCGTVASAGGSQTVGFTTNAGGDSWGIIAVEILPSAGSASVMPVQRGRQRHPGHRHRRQQATWSQSVALVSDVDSAAGTDAAEIVTGPAPSRFTGLLALASQVAPGPSPDSDAGTGTDAGTVIRLSSTETASAADAAEKLSLSSTETASAADGAEKLSLSAAETGHGADAAEAVTAALADSDTGHGTDAAEKVRVSDADTGHGTDAGESLAAHLADSDTGHGTDAAESVRVSTADTASTTESAGTVTAHLTDSDTASAADTAETVRVTGADTAHGTDAGEATIQGARDSDTASGADAGEHVTAALSGAEAAQGADAAERVRVSAADTAGAADTGAISAQLVADSDAAQGADASGPVGLSGTDTAQGADAGERPRVADSDSVQAADAAETVRVSGTDTASAADASGPVTLPGADSAQAADASGNLRVADTEAAAGTDAFKLTAAALGDSDTAHGTDAGEGVRLLPGPDTGQGLDAGEHTAAALADSEAAQGTGSEPSAVRLADADTASAAENAFSPAGHNVSDSDTALGLDSEIDTFTPDNDAGSASDGGEAVAVRLKDADTAKVTEAAPVPGGTWVAADADTAKAAEAQYWSGPLSDADTAHGTDAELRTRSVADSDSCAMAEGFTLQVDAYVPLNRWTGGGFRTVAPEPPSHVDGSAFEPTAPRQVAVPARVTAAARPAVRVSLDIRKSVRIP